MTEEGLVGYNGWLHGDRKALERTVAVYNTKLIYYIGSTLCAYGEAEDIASEVFLRLLIKKPRFDREEQLCAWLYKTARNCLLDQLRKKSRELPEEALPESGGDAEVLDAILEDERRAALHRALGKLSGIHREVLTLIYFGGLSYGQTATVLKKSEAQIKSLAFRARNSLKDELERMGYGNEN